jgi:hypothetical protein
MSKKNDHIQPVFRVTQLVTYELPIGTMTEALERSKSLQASIDRALAVVQPYCNLRRRVDLAEISEYRGEVYVGGITNEEVVEDLFIEWLDGLADICQDQDGDPADSQQEQS